MSAQSTVDRDLSVGPAPGAGPHDLAHRAALGRKDDDRPGAGGPVGRVGSTGRGARRRRGPQGADRRAGVQPRLTVTRTSVASDMWPTSSAATASTSSARSSRRSAAARDEVRARHAESTPESPIGSSRSGSRPRSTCAPSATSRACTHGSAPARSPDSPASTTHTRRRTIPSVELRTDELDLDTCSIASWRCWRDEHGRPHRRRSRGTVRGLRGHVGRRDRPLGGRHVRQPRCAWRPRWPTPSSSIVATQVDPAIEVVFLDTQYHFPETLARSSASRSATT